MQSLLNDILCLCLPLYLTKTNSFKQYCLTQGDTPWNPSFYSDQVADKFYQQVIDNDQKNSLNTKSDHSSDIKIDLVEQDIPKLSYFDPVLLMIHMIQMTKETMQI
jgi:hypothetical protein